MTKNILKFEKENVAGTDSKDCQFGQSEPDRPPTTTISTTSATTRLPTSAVPATTRDRLLL